MQRRFENSHDFQNSPRKIKLSEASLNERIRKYSDPQNISTSITSGLDAAEGSSPSKPVLP